ncbi:hypothetical protein VNI00_002139 [Paramarasmius palmivorus]|uniref:F-box domain-containing protein n=1 Tax=Paramarasmius palmivorus TaxID=297713 RepID=A0AAW0E428_9AGAR
MPAPAPLCQNCQARLVNTQNAIHQQPQPPLDIQVLRSNHLLTDLEASQIPLFLETKVPELERLEKEIGELVKQRDALRQDIERRSSWLAPIRRLPVEILVHILSYVCLGEFSLDISSTDSGDLRYCPLECDEYDSARGRQVIYKNIVATTCSLSQVCHYWRRIINASPELWSSLRIDFTQMEEVHEDLVDLYLTRSAQHPLKIDIYDPVIHNWEGYEILKDAIVIFGQTGFDVFCTVIAELHRTKEFSYRFHTDAVLDFVKHRFRAREFPLLTSLNDETVEISQAYWFWDLVHDTPNLTSLTSERFIPVEWLPENLQTLKVKHQSGYADLLEMLPHLSKLRSLHLHDFSPDAIPDTPTPVLAKHMNLREFTVTTERPLSYLNLLFASLTLPNLTSLRIFTGQLVSEDRHSTKQNVQAASYRVDQLAALCTLIERSGCLLRDLTLHVEPFPSDAFIALLEFQPSLVELDLEIRIQPSGSQPLVLVDLVDKMITSQALLPSVQHLVIHEHSYHDYRDYDVNDMFSHLASVVGMLEARAMGNRISDASLSFGRWIPSNTPGIQSKRYDIPAGIADRIQGLCMRGLKYRVTLPKMLKGDKEVVQ